MFGSTNVHYTSIWSATLLSAIKESALWVYTNLIKIRISEQNKDLILIRLGSTLILLWFHIESNQGQLCLIQKKKLGLL